MSTFKQTIMFVALPNGIIPSKSSTATQSLRLSVFISPRLVTNASQRKLELFPDFGNWTQVVQRMKFAVRFRGIQNLVVAAEFDPQTLDTRLWPAIFRRPVVVRPYEYGGHDKQFVCSNQTTALYKLIRDLYQDLAATSVTTDARPHLPSVRFLIGQPDPHASQLPIANHLGSLVLSKLAVHGENAFAPSREVWRQAQLAAGRHSPEKGFFEPPRPGENTLAPLLELFKLALKDPNVAQQVKPLMQSPLKDFLHLLVFHAPRNPQEVDAAPPIVPQPAPDFHDMLSHLSEYPVLLRRLGLVVDLSVPISNALGSQLKLGGAINVVLPNFKPQLNGPGGKIETRIVTPLTMLSGDFRARDRADSDSAGGMLLFNNAERFQPVQVDVDGAALKLFYLANNLQQSIDKASADTPRETGAPALRTGGIAVVHQARTKSFKARMQDATAFNNQLESAQPDDLTGGLTFAANDLERGYRVDVREIKDTIALPWRSLCQRRGRYGFTTQTGQHFTLKQTLLSKDNFVPDESTVTTAPTSGQPPPAVAGQPQPPPDLYLQESLFRWDGWSLAVRRPGLALAVDEKQAPVTDASPTMEPLDAGQKTYGMDVSFDIAPNTLPRLRFGHTYQLRARTVDLAGNSRAFDDDTPPARNAATPALLYQRFEPVAAPLVLMGNKQTDGESLERVVVRSFGQGQSFKVGSAALSTRHVLPPRVSQQTAELHGMFDGLPDDHAYDLIALLDSAADGKVKLSSVNQVRPIAVNYLPDPLAKFVRLCFIQDGKLVKNEVMPCYGAGDNWPRAQSFIFTVKPGYPGLQTEIKIDAARRLVAVTLPPAETLTVRLSIDLLPEDLEKLMGVYRWLLQKAEETNDKTLVQNFKKMYSLYGSWLLSPARELLLVHTVQQPLLVPKITQMSAQRDLVGQTQSAVGQTKATLAGQIDLHNKSTIKVDLLARWDEYTGTGLTPDKPVTGSAHVCELPATANEEGGVQFKAQAQEFGDTKHRNVRYMAEATTRFREYFLTQIDQAKPFALSVTSSDPGTSLLPARQNVLSTARPTAPKVQYVVPTFRWERREYGGGMAVSSVRRGGGLRVYLDGPWYSSGEGEQLGVVWATEVSDQLAPLVTQWGRDPIHVTPAPPTQVSYGNFKLLAKSGSNLSLEEMPGSSVAVAGHEVKFDNDGGAAGLGARWYCDMELGDAKRVRADAFQLTDVPSYFPFIQLALARYQPDSIPGVELSRVVRTDFIQLTPDRIAVFIFSDKEPLVLGHVHDDSSLNYPFGAQTARLTIGAQQVTIQPDTDNLRAIEAALNALPLLGRRPNRFVAIYVAGRSPLEFLDQGRRLPLQTPNFIAVALQRATSATKKSELDWMPVKLPGGELDFQLLLPIWSGESNPEITQWVGQIPLPDDVATGNYRIVLNETETMKADVVDAQTGLSDVNNKTLDVSRTVYLDTLEC
jgi:hypothetical protein